MTRRSEKDRERHNRLQQAGSGPYRIEPTRPTRASRRKAREMTKLLNQIVPGAHQTIGTAWGIKLDKDGKPCEMTQAELEEWQTPALQRSYQQTLDALGIKIERPQNS